MSDLPRARFLDGPNFSAWLEEVGVPRSGLSDTEIRKLADWKDGARADADSDTVDGLLTRYGLPTSYLPDELWAEDQSYHSGRRKPRQRSSQIPRKTRTLARDLLADGMTPETVRNITGLRLVTLKRWQQEVAEQIMEGAR